MTTTIRYPLRTAKLLGTIALAGLATGVGVGVARSRIPDIAAMNYRQLIAEPRYNGTWGQKHAAEGSTLWEEVRHHKLPGDTQYWIEIIRSNSQNTHALSDGYQKGDMISVPVTDAYGR